GYAQAGGLYLSFMSGNTTRLGTALAALNLHVLLGTAMVICAFVIGAVAGTLVVEAPVRRPMLAVLGVEIALLCGALALVAAGSLMPPLFLISIAMGMQNSAHQVVLGADVGKSFVTGTLFSFGQSLVAAAKGRVRPMECAIYGLSWLTFIAGVAGGGDDGDLDGVGLGGPPQRADPGAPLAFIFFHRPTRGGAGRSIRSEGGAVWICELSSVCRTLRTQWLSRWVTNLRSGPRIEP
ncbi:MAG: hypothetical protein B7Y61_10420, partial [Rhizobiales bacterium 35-66-30]